MRKPIKYRGRVLSDRFDYAFDFVIKRCWHFDCIALKGFRRVFPVCFDIVERRGSMV